MKQIRSLRENHTDDANLDAREIVVSANFSENKAAIRIQSLFLRALALRTMTDRFTFVWQRGIILYLLAARLLQASCIEDVKKPLLAQPNKFAHRMFSPKFCSFRPEIQDLFLV